VQYSGLKAEHQAVRRAVGMFDISHMGKFLIHGDRLIEKLQFLVPSNLARLTAGSAQYTVLLNEQAGIIDDIIFYYQGDNQGLFIVNAATTEKDWQWLQQHLQNQEIQLQDISGDRLLIAIQGPQSETALQPFCDRSLSELKLFQHLEAKVCGEIAFIARTGYTGEDGFEVMIPENSGRQLWQNLIHSGVIPCGLGARDTLRLEAGLCLYGQDMDDATTPLEAGLGWLIHWEEKGDFIGKEILLQQKETGVKKRLIGLEMPGRHIARHGYPVLKNDVIIGEITSGTLSPTLEKAIALAYVPTEYSKMGQEILVEIRGKTYPGKIIKKPFYRPKIKMS
jgi:aminomethyltransferase